VHHQRGAALASGKLMTSIHFDKYDRKGAYHWIEYEGGLLRMSAYTRARYDLVCRCVRAALPDGGSGEILDLGCGDGALAGALSRELCRPVVGADTSERGLALAAEMFGKKGLRGEFRLISGYDTGLAGGRFAAVVCSEVIEHVDDPRAMLDEIYRLLSPGGHLVITTPIRFSELPVDPMHVQEWFVGDFTALCSAVFGAPVQVIRSHPVLWYELVTSSRRWTGRAGRLAANLLTMLGHNPFLQTGGAWRCYTTQTLVLQKRVTPPWAAQ
jgi:2-polyprenyl-3-methyl-5-hydroxy-6-metoxy-1,4-benzoquinol methylase